MPGPGLLSAIVVGKYADHLPLYRLEDVFARAGVELSRSTLCRWALQTADILEPLYRLMIERVRSSAVIHTHDTPVPVLDPALPKTRTACECFVTVRSTATLRSNHGYRTTILVLFGFRRVIVQPLSSTQLTGLPNTRRLRARLHPAGLRRDFW